MLISYIFVCTETNQNQYPKKSIEGKYTKALKMHISILFIRGRLDKKRIYINFLQCIFLIKRKENSEVKNLLEQLENERKK